MDPISTFIKNKYTVPPLFRKCYLNLDIFSRGHGGDIHIVRPELLHFDFHLVNNKEVN